MFWYRTSHEFHDKPHIMIKWWPEDDDSVVIISNQFVGVNVYVRNCRTELKMILTTSLLNIFKVMIINNRGQYLNCCFFLYKPVFIKNSGGMMLSDHLPFDTKHLCREVVRLVKSESFTTSKISMTTLNISLKISMPTLKITLTTTLKRTLTISQNTRRPYWQPTMIFPSWIVEHNT